MGRFFKEFDIPFEAARDQIMGYVQEKHGTSLVKDTYDFADVNAFKEACPAIRSLFDALKEKQNLNYWDNLSYVGICILQPFKTLRPHVDCSPSMVGVNIPLMNCEGSVTQFHRGWASAQWDIQAGVSGISVNSEKVMEEFELNKLTLFLPKVPHGVLNMKDSVRVMCSLRFTEDPLDLFFRPE